MVFAPNAPPHRLHSNASGDFTLLSREQWGRLGGYPEFEAHALHVDSLFCFIAHYSGVLITHLLQPCAAFHIEHSNATGWIPEGEEELCNRIQRVGIPFFRGRELMSLGREIQARGQAIQFNDETWGLARCQVERVARPGKGPDFVEHQLLTTASLSLRERVCAARREESFERYIVAYLREENARLKRGELHWFKKGINRWWMRTRRRWKRSLRKRLPALFKEE